jgi:hypothetical protein
MCRLVVEIYWWGVIAGPSLDLCRAHHDSKLPFGSWPVQNEPELQIYLQEHNRFNKCTIQVVFIENQIYDGKDQNHVLTGHDSNSTLRQVDHGHHDVTNCNL